MKYRGLVGLRVRIVDEPHLDPGNGIGTIVHGESKEIGSSFGTNVFVAIDKPGMQWNTVWEDRYGRGWWYRLNEIELLDESLP
jgi:hypothetical protein